MADLLFPRSLRSPRRPAPEAETPGAVITRLSRQIRTLQEQNDRLRKALADERRVADILLRIDRFGAIAQ